MLVCAEEPAKNGDVVVAMDFGTSRSTLAYTIVGYEDEPVKIIKLSSFDLKASTSVLIDEGKVRAFGFDAEQQFAEGCTQSSADWMLFKWFKMTLHKPFESNPLVECFGGGAQLRLSDLLQKSFEYVKSDVLRHLKLGGVIHHEDACKLFWVLTVPAIWSDYAKYVMRTAAYKAGLIDSEQSCHLFLALEPECAAIASQMDPFQKKLWDVGTKFLIADCGGGTLDITSHEVLQSSPVKLEELTQPVGGTFGATQVDKKFLDFFENLVGTENFHRLQREVPVEYLSLVKEWEEKKVTFRFDRSNNEWTRLNVVNALLAVGICSDFGLMIDAWNERNPNKAVEKLSRRIKLALSFDLMVSFFEETVSTIVDQIGDTVDTLRGLDCVVMVGGFARCVLLQEKVRERFAPTSVDVIVANDPDLLIVKGAAIFGARPPRMIRKSLYTFGVGSMVEYDVSNARHRRYKDNQGSSMVNGQELLPKFSIHGRVGDNVDESKGIRIQYVPLTPDQDTATLEILATEDRDVFHPEEEGVRELASTSVPFDMDLPFVDRRVCVEFLFGGTEVRCLIFDALGDKEIGSVPIHFKFFE